MLNNKSNALKSNLQLNESMFLFQGVLDISDEAIFILDKNNFTILDCNQAALRLFEADSKNLVLDQPSSRLYNTEPFGFSQDKLIEELLSKGEYTQELSFRTLKQNVFWGKLTQKNLGFTGSNYSILKVEKSANFLKEESWLSEVLKISSKSTGRQFFKDITRLLCKTFDADHAFIARRVSGDNSRMKVFYIHGNDIQTKYIQIHNSFIENVLRGYVSYYPTGLGELFPNDELILETRANSFIGAPFIDASQEPMGIIGVISSKTMVEIPNSRYMLNILASRTSAEMHRIRSKEILRQQTKNLALINQMKDKLLLFISNDLQAPFNTILGYSGMIRNKLSQYKPEELSEKIRVMDNSLKNLYQMLENLSDWSKLQQDKVKVCLRPNNLGNIFDDIKPYVKYISELRNIAIINKMPSVLNVSADNYLARAVFKNLSSYLLKNTMKDGSLIYDAQLHQGNWSIVLRAENHSADAEEITTVLNASREEFDIATKDLTIPGLSVYISREFMKIQGGKLSVNISEKALEFILEFNKA